MMKAEAQLNTDLCGDVEDDVRDVKVAVLALEPFELLVQLVHLVVASTEALNELEFAPACGWRHPCCRSRSQTAGSSCEAEQGILHRTTE
jgi:hypothetical protein